MKNNFLYVVDLSKSENLKYHLDWYENFKRKFDVLDLSKLNLKNLVIFFRKYELIVFGYSINYTIDQRKAKFLKRLLNTRKTTVAFFIQNEFRDLKKKIELFEFLNGDILLTQLDLQIAQSIYPKKIQKILSIPHGLNTLEICSRINHKRRKYDFAICKNSDYPLYCGNISRNIVIPRFLKKIKKINSLQSQINTFSVPHKKWYQLLLNSRTTVACESGSAFLQLNDEMRKKINKLSFVNQELILKKYLNRSKNSFNGLSIPARVFEAAASGTTLILVEGRYLNLFNNGKHFIELKKDLSNLNTVIQMMEDEKYTEILAKKFLKFCQKHHTLELRIKKIIDAI